MTHSHEYPSRETWRQWMTWPGVLGLSVCCAAGVGMAFWAGALAPHPLFSVTYGSAACLYLGLPAVFIGFLDWVLWLCIRKRFFRCMSVVASAGLAGVVCFALVLPVACRHFMREAIIHDRLAGEMAHRQLLAKLKAGTLEPDSRHDNPATDPVLKSGLWEGYLRLPATDFKGRIRGTGDISGSIGFTTPKPVQGELAVMIRRGEVWDIYDGRSWSTISIRFKVEGWRGLFHFPSE